MQRNKPQILGTHKLQQRSSSGKQRRRLIKISIEGAKYPVYFWHPGGGSKTWTSGIFYDISGKMSLSDASIQSQPGRDAKFIFHKSGDQRASDALPIAKVVPKG